MPSDFEKQSYWHERFVSEQSFEWLVSSEGFMAELEPHLSELHEDARVLHLGCGTSDLQNHFRRRGVVNVTNVDYEPLAIARGKQLEEAAFGDVQMKYFVADATQLRSSGCLEGKFDLVVDKSTADAISCAGGEAVLKLAESVDACLAEGGVWISMSYSSTRFEVEGLPFRVGVLAKVLTPKTHSSEPDVYHTCYMLRPKGQVPSPAQ